MADLRRRDFTRGALALSALTWLPLSVRSAAADPKKGGILAYATVSGPGGLDPHVSSSAVELEVIHNLFEPLVTLDNQNATKTMLAAKASASPDAKDLHIRASQRRQVPQRRRDDLGGRSGVDGALR
jgi:peptide/nickel transport system substrate-binding protein